MTVRTSILTLIVAGLASAAPAAQAMLLSGNSAGSTKSSLSAREAAAIRQHAQAMYRDERFVGTSAPQHLSPDNRGGVRGV